MGSDWKWDWWSESPIEIIVVVLFLVILFAFPHKGMGITPVTGEPTPAHAQH